MELAVGAVLEGKVTGIMKFGAFVALEGGKSGLVHISEIANTYVSDVNEHLQVGQTVKVRVLNISDDGKINLSIKRAEEAPRREAPARRENQPRRDNREFKPREQTERQPCAETAPRPAAPADSNQDFEDRLKKFMKDSDSRIADNRMYSERRQRTRRR